VKFEFIAKHRGIWPVTWMCGVLDVSPSGFYSWRSRPPSDRALYDEELIRDIRRSFCDSGETCGVRRIWLDLLDWGHDVGRERAARLVRSLRLLAQPKRRRRPVDKGQRLESAIAPNSLDREFTATAPNQKWVADFTYVWTAEGWLYVAAVLDLFARRIVGWSMKSRMTADLVTDALIMAIWRRQPDPELLHHSDQGSQYTCEQFQKLLADHGIECSMSRLGECHDNAVMESFFSRMKDDRVSRRRYRTRDEARADIFDYIERFYNPRRRHSTLGGMSPVEYEKRAKLA
jgi:putative transposase